MEHHQVDAAAAALKRERRRARVRPSRFWAPPNRSWLMVRTMPGRAVVAADDLRRQGIPIFEARVAMRFVTSRGQQRDVEVALLKRTLFVGIATLTDLIRVERCIWIAKVLSPSEDGIDWIERGTFRPSWVETELFRGRRMPVISRSDMQRFADHVTGHMKGDEAAPESCGLAFEVGVNVRVLEGPFASFTGVVERFNGETELYTVAVNVFGKSAPVDLCELALEAS